jgi:hypothetical protein
MNLPSQKTTRRVARVCDPELTRAALARHHAAGRDGGLWDRVEELCECVFGLGQLTERGLDLVG